LVTPKEGRCRIGAETCIESFEAFLDIGPDALEQIEGRPEQRTIEIKPISERVKRLTKNGHALLLMNATVLWRLGQPTSLAWRMVGGVWRLEGTERRL
jgi:hypothetical protein